MKKNYKKLRFNLLILILSQFLYASNVKKEHIEYEKYKITIDDSYEKCLNKLNILFSLKNQNSTNYYYDFLIENAEFAHNNFQGDPEIIILALRIMITFKYDRFDVLTFIIPYLQEVNNYECVSNYISNFFKRLSQIMTNNIKSKNPLLSRYFKLFNTNDTSILLKNILLLEKYFNSFNDGNIKMPVAERRDAIKLFNMLIINYNKEKMNNLLFQESIKIENDIINRQNERDKEFYEKRKREKEEFERTINKLNLNDFNELGKLPNTFEKIQRIFIVLSYAEKELSNYDNIPTYEKLKEIFKGSNEAEFLNYAFKVFIKKDYQKYLDYFTKNLNLHNNVRALKLKLFCMKELKMNLNTQLELVQKIISLDKKDLNIRLYETNLIFTLEGK